MIFLSHNYRDKAIVEQIAVPLAAKYGQDQVFYDSWTIGPGDGIIDKMNSGLSEATFFFYFISRNSLQSGMVDLEWQNALMASVKGNLRFIPVRLDNAEVPAILLQRVFIDLFNRGLDHALTQIENICDGQNTFERQHPNFHNLLAEIHDVGEHLVITISAQHFVEPRISFYFLTDAKEDEIDIHITSAGTQYGGYKASLSSQNGDASPAFYFRQDQSLAPGFPLRLKHLGLKGTKPSLKAVLHEQRGGGFAEIPTIWHPKRSGG